MKPFDRKKHWNSIYQSKTTNEVSWYEQTPTTSLAFFNQLQIPRTAKIIDIGGGDSLLADHLLALGYEHITVLDISEAAIQKARQRLGKNADRVQWIVADAAQFKPTEQYDVWHDRAAFHFLTDDGDISAYIDHAQKGIAPNGILIVGTFSKQGPTSCSGIEIKQYSQRSITNRFKAFFKKIKCITIDHKTPFNTLQHFVFCSFRKPTVLK
ncbi:MAG: class I SAM-dependent methyltransferase [Niabella sp.]|nr:class I SAM-dependent methyltransferase [Niabella sp.]